ncbi:MAG: hypothetical protein KBD32_05980 [Burkholderiales bacterium]|nr:hypothetical protein [Burkholderiales bacterium]
MQILENNFNIKLTVQEVMNFINRVNSKHSEFNNLILIRHVNGSDELKNTAVEFHNLFVIHKSIKNRLPQIDFENIMITSENITELVEPEAMIYSKRLLRLYDISDDVLIQQRQSTFGHEDIDLIQIQNNIHNNFHTEAKQLMKDVIQNYVTFLTQRLTNVYKKEII